MVNAGWMVESRSSDGDSRKTYIEGDLLCDESDGDHTIIDMKSRQIAFVNHKSKTYASSTMDELKKGVAASRELLDKTMSENMKNMSPEQQASYKQMMGSRDAKKPDVKYRNQVLKKLQDSMPQNIRFTPTTNLLRKYGLHRMYLFQWRIWSFNV